MRQLVADRDWQQLQFEVLKLAARRAVTQPVLQPYKCQTAVPPSGRTCVAAARPDEHVQPHVRSDRIQGESARTDSLVDPFITRIGQNEFADPLPMANDRLKRSADRGRRRPDAERRDPTRTSASCWSTQLRKAPVGPGANNQVSESAARLCTVNAIGHGVYGWKARCTSNCAITAI